MTYTPAFQKELDQYAIDAADDDLLRIVRLKEELTEWLDNCWKVDEFPISKTKHDEWAAIIEEQFDERFYKQWHRNYKISGAATWPTEIPSCEALRFKAAA